MLVFRTAHLPLPGLDDARVRVADVGDVVDHVEERPARLVVEEGARAPDDLERRAVGERERRAEAAPALGADAGGVLGGRPERRAGNAQDEVGIGREREPDRALARRADPVEVAVPVQHVRDDLEVDVGRPVAVAGRRADRADALSARDRRPGRQRPDRVGRQVAVERVEAGSVLGRVLQDHRRPVVEPRGVVADGVNASRQAARRRGSRAP